MVVQDPPRTGDIGTVIGSRYRLDRVVGRGGMSVVYAATDTKLGRTVAVKLLAPGIDPRDAGRLGEELRLLAAFDHPGLVTVFDAVPGPDERLAVVMQWVDGEDLAARLASGPLPPARVAAIGAEIAAALSYLAGRDVVHRDVKPANVLLSSDGRARLADLGIARIVGDDGPTATGSVIGTARYLSPEQVRGEPVGPASDVYSLGLMLLESLTGRPAYPGTDAESSIARLTRDPPIPAALGTQWVSLLHGMTASSPADRMSATTAASGLRSLQGMAGAADAVTERLAPAVPQSPQSAPTLPALPAVTKTARRPAARRGVMGTGLAIALIAFLLLGIGAATIWLVSLVTPIAGAPEATSPRAVADLVLEKQPPTDRDDDDDDDDNRGPGNGNGNGNGGENGNGNGNGGRGDG